MNKGIQKAALLAFVMGSMAMAGASKSTDPGTSQGSNSAAGQTDPGTASSASAGQGSNGSGNSSAQGVPASNPGSDGKGSALQRKKARAARHADIDKARQQAMDSTKAEFGALEEATVAGTSAIVSEKVQEEKSKH